MRTSRCTRSFDDHHRMPCSSRLRAERLEMGAPDAQALGFGPLREAQLEVSEHYLTSLTPQQIKQKSQSAPEGGQQRQRQQVQQPDDGERDAR